MGKILFWLGVGITMLGLLIWMGDKVGIPFGKLPGDFQWKSEKISFYFPLATTVILSLILTIVLNLAFWLFRK